MIGMTWHVLSVNWPLPLPPTDQKPTMPELTGLKGKSERINIAKEIGVQWWVVGIALLDDKNGTVTPAIAQQYGNNAELINMEILTRWINGKGMADCTWHGLIGVLKEHCTALAESVEEILTEQEVTDPPSTDQPDHTPPPPGHLRRFLQFFRCPPLEPQSAVYHFSAYLKSIYGRCVDPVVKWPLLPGEKYINLAVINREEVKSKEQRAFMLATLHGGVDEILEIKHPVTIENLLDMPIGKILECVLVEGAPGVGKSTLSWEICKCWKKGILFQQFSLLLLLRLRDQTLHTARTAKDLILYPVRECLEEISQYLLKDTRGKYTLIILEGLDELPRYLLTQPSVFTRLLDGTELPDATILVTSRPSATAQLWENWKSRISKHVEVLGFTDQNITDYVTSILDPKDIPAFDTYLCRAPSIRQQMYIPLHSGIIVELFRMYTDSDRHLPTTKAALYAGIVNTILTRYLANNHKYKEDKIKVNKFADLPSDVYPVFMELTELAYQSILQQQLIFEDNDKPINHLGFMDEVAELFPLECKTRLSYNFLHLSLQEYLAAIHVSLMDARTQERLLNSMLTKQHLNNTCVFLAAITHFKGLDREIVKHAIQSECKIGEEGYATDALALSANTLEIVFETGDVSLLEGHSSYTYKLSDYTPLFDFTALGQCIAQSSYTWKLQLGNTQQHMQLTQGVEQLVHTIQSNGSPTFTIDTIECYHEETQCKQQLLTGLPLHTLLALDLSSSTLQPLPQCLPELVHNTNSLLHLMLWRAAADSLATTLQALHTSPTSTLQALCLTGSKFTQPLMQAICRALLRHNKSMEVVQLGSCGIADEQAFCLAETLPSLNKLSALHLTNNDIHDAGALAIAEAIHRLPELSAVDMKGNPLGDKGCKALEEYKKTKKDFDLRY